MYTYTLIIAQTWSLVGIYVKLKSFSPTKPKRLTIR
jgi:hypothetical protein